MDDSEGWERIDGTRGPAAAREQLLQACREGDAERAIDLIKQGGVSVNATGPDGFSALHVAVDADKENIVRLLLDMGADGNVVSANDAEETPLHTAVRLGTVHAGRTLLKYRQKINVNALDRQLHSPLHLACLRYDVECVRLLVAKKAEVNTLSVGGRSPLLDCVLGGHIALVRLLLGNGARLLHCAPAPHPLSAAFTLVNPTILLLLLTNMREGGEKLTKSKAALLQSLFEMGCEGEKADFVQVLLTHFHSRVEHGQKKGGTDTLKFDTDRALVRACKMGNLPVLDVLLRERSSVLDVKGTDGEVVSLMTVVPKRGGAGVVERLLSHPEFAAAIERSGGEAGAKCKRARQAVDEGLAVACQRGRLDVARLLIGTGLCTAEGVLAGLHRCCKRGHVQVAELLMERETGVDVNKPNSAGRSAVVLAAFAAGKIEAMLGGSVGSHESSDRAGSGHDEEVEDMIEEGSRGEGQEGKVRQKRFKQGADDCDVVVRKLQRALDLLSMLLRKGGKAEVQATSTSSLLGAVVIRGWEKVAITLLQNGCHPDYVLADSPTPLYHACGMGKVNVVRKLLHFGADPCLAWRSLSTPLLVAVESGHVEMVEILLAAGASASPDVPPKYSPAVAVVAGVQGKAAADILELLVRYGLDVNKQYERSKPLLYTACAAGRVGLASFLLLHGAAVECEGCLSPLAAAVRKDNEEMVKLLLAHGARTEGVYERGVPVLHYVRMTLRGERILRRLLESGADPNVRREDGRTLLHFACRAGAVGIVRLLVKA
uniref:Uncharacterized protein n=1 Tax=Palpitomonas bilix TaxID=652834 RepID=A0A7S3D213_9EUKA|mmetsp:Transcript_16721/g.41982  ORF Transcript_16721/g.41982 Transcript_16721/m.41982 type:complete len:773 (+) Transcript_16721:338-2656(+)